MRQQFRERFREEAIMPVCQNNTGTYLYQDTRIRLLPNFCDKRPWSVAILRGLAEHIVGLPRSECRFGLDCCVDKALFLAPWVKIAPAEA
jgi:hypothetical protein